MFGLPAGWVRLELCCLWVGERLQVESPCSVEFADNGFCKKGRSIIVWGKSPWSGGHLVACLPLHNRNLIPLPSLQALRKDVFNTEEDPSSRFRYIFLSISKLFNSLLCNFLFECYKEHVSGVIGFPLFICWFGNGKGVCLFVKTSKI
jgi:hypothetical protein